MPRLTAVAVGAVLGSRGFMGELWVLAAPGAVDAAAGVYALADSVVDVDVAANPVVMPVVMPVVFADVLLLSELLPQAANTPARQVASRSLSSGLRDGELDFTGFLGQKKA